MNNLAWSFGIGYVVCVSAICTPRSEATAAQDPGTETSTGPGSGVPGDPDIAVGPNHVMVVSNTKVAVYAKGSFAAGDPPIASWPMFDDIGTSGFWDSVGAETPFDPEVLYDPFDDRFWVMAMEYFHVVPTRNWFDIAVSASSDPTDGWHLYRLDAIAWADGYLLPGYSKLDSPNMSVDGDKLFLNGWVIDFTSLPPSFKNERTSSPLWILGKAEALIGSPEIYLQKQFIPMPTTGPSPRTYDRRAVPALVQNFNPETTAPQYMLGVDPDYPVPSNPRSNEEWDELSLHAVRFDPDGEPYIDSYDLGVDKYRAPEDTAPQLGSYPKLKLVSPRFWGTPVLRDGHIWATHHVRQPTGDQNVVRWYKFDLNGWPVTPAATPSLAAYGTIEGDDSNNHTYFPSVGVNQDYDMLITYNESGNDDSDFVSVRRSLFLGPSLTPVAKTNVKNDASLVGYIGGGNDPERWGDYSGTESDPSDPCVFWSHHMIAITDDPTVWSTWLARSSPAELCDPGDNTRATLGLVDLNGDGLIDLFDVLTFRGFFVHNVREADFNGDGILNLSDFVDFMIAFESARSVAGSP